MTVAGEKIITGLKQAVDHARSMDATAPAPAPWDWQTVSANASGGFHLYILDANDRKIAAVWGHAGEKLNTANLMRAAPDLREALHDLLVAAEKHIFGDECREEREAARRALAVAEGDVP